MKTKLKLKIVADLFMSIALLLLMAYELIGQSAHEWIGIGMFVLLVLHHILNGNWSRHIFKGRYTAFRIIQTILVALVALSMLGSMISGVILSRYAFAFLPIHGGQALARILHMLSAYWGFVFMSLHLGFHWNMMMGMAGRLVKRPSKTRKWALRIAALLIAGYGVYAFVDRGFPEYMLLQTQFVFFDFEESRFLFLADYIAVMGMFLYISHYFSVVLRKIMERIKKCGCSDKCR